MRLRRAGLALLLAWPVGAVVAAEPAEPTDEQFVASLAAPGAAGPIDRRRLARLMFSAASTLDAGRSGLRFLHGRIVVSSGSAAAVGQLLEDHLAGYASAVSDFKRSATTFLDQPESLLGWYQVLLDGQHACWQLDVHQRVIETYGASAEDLMTAAASREACTRLRTTAFQPRVAAIVRDALVEQIYQRDELRRLEQQVAELERLVEELAGIAGAP